ncbi:MAG: polysaccharide deacetylase [Bacteroidetes bacterium]|nr:polysaccharide deacetylase [Bacteroidota bacterium]
MGFVKDKTLGFFVKTNGFVSKQVYGGLGLAFMLHRVLPADLRNQYSINRDLAITPEHLESVITYLTKKGCRFVSLDELHETLRDGKTPDQKLICMTLDDGYRDNMEYGLPVFKKYNVPVAIYITNCFPNQTALLWWYILEHRIFHSFQLKIETESVKKEYNWKTIQQGVALYPEIRDVLKALPKKDFARVIRESFQIDDAYIQEQCKAQALTWAEITQLSREKNVTIGAHTMNHLSMKTLTDDELQYEISASKKELEEKTGKPAEHFAYPYGGFEDAYAREYKAAKEVFKTATINHRGNISAGQRDFMECIPRMPLAESATPQKLDYMLNGIDHFSFNGFTKTIHY